MPFTITDVPPKVTSKVTIKFSGLMVLQPGANETCEIGVHHRDLHHHVNQVMLIVDKPNLPPTLVPLLSGELTEPFEIRLYPDPGAGDFKVFQRDQDPFDWILQNNNQYDYRWAINLRDGHRDVQLNNGAKPFVILHTGVLYTSNLTLPELKPKFTVPDHEPKDLNQIAADLAASIDLPDPRDNTRVHLKWGKEKELLLPRKVDDRATTTYTVYFINEPPNLTSPANLELLSPYYTILEKSNGKPFDRTEQCTLSISHIIVSDAIPCMPTTKNP